MDFSVAGVTRLSVILITAAADFIRVGHCTGKKKKEPAHGRNSKKK